MYVIEVDFECVLAEYPDCVDGFIDSLECSPGKNKDKIDYNKIKFFYHFGFFKTKSAKNDETKYKLVYEDRLKLELSKVRLDISMESGKFIIQDRFDNTSSLVSVIVADIVKSMIYAEQLHFKDPIVMDSIREYIKLREEEEEEDRPLEDYELDDILDKISAKGMESLTSKELDFLRKSSE